MAIETIKLLEEILMIFAHFWEFLFKWGLGILLGWMTDKFFS